MEGHQYTEWDVKNGSRAFRHDNIYSLDVKSDTDPKIGTILETIWKKFIWWMKEASDEDKGIDYVFTLVNPQYQLGNNPGAFQMLMDLCHHLPESTVRVVMVTDDITLPETYSKYFIGVDFELPGHSELLSRLHVNLEDYAEPGTLQLTDDDYDMVSVAAAGMQIQDFDVAVSSTVVNTMYNQEKAGEELSVTVDHLIAGVHVAKTEAIKKSDILELLESGDMSEVGGMDLAKEWVRMRSNCYSDEAIAFGVEPPKGMVSVGVPGSGKSLLAKAVGSELGIPVVRLDFGKVFNSLVGSSEERMRKALKQVEAMSPCVLFVDEIDKGLGGLGGSGDSGTSMRVFGTFLTWLQENVKPVFTMVTANNVKGLPPELLRRGRFDQIFATTLPNEYEREDVLAIHLKKRDHSIDDFTGEEIEHFLEASDECVAAEIESLVKDALVLAYNENQEEPELRMEHLLKARESMVPLAKSHKEAIAEMVRWSNDNATPASYSKKQLAEMRPKRRGKVNKAKAKRSSGKTRTRRPATVTDIKPRSRRKPSGDK